MPAARFVQNTLTRLRALRSRARVALARASGVEIGPGVTLGPRCDLQLGFETARRGRLSLAEGCELAAGVVLHPYDGDISVGAFVHLGPGVVVYGHGGVVIGEHTLVAMHCRVLSSEHAIPPEGRDIRGEPSRRLPTRIGSDVWLGAGVTVLGGVTVGDGCVVGAGAVVTRDLPAYSIALGVPARVVGRRAPTPPATPMNAVPDISVVIPVFNRGELIRHTLDSVRAASAGLRVEVVAVDDGSTVPLADDLARLGLSVDKLVRQPNRGLLFARLAGLEAAAGRLVLFLDSDDLVSKEKLRLHVEAMRAGAWDVTYTDHAVTTTRPDGSPSGETAAEAPLADASDAPGFYLRVKPAPHCPVFDAAYLRGVVAAAGFPPSPAFNPVAEIWFYHKASVRPARVLRLPGPHAVVCHHGGGRITDHWERLGVASLCVMECFLADTPDGPHRVEARALVAANALDAWRRHPLGLPRELEHRFLAVWRAGRDPRFSVVGTASFRRLASVLGLLPAARLLRRLRNKSYASIRTLSPHALAALIAANPPPPRK